METKAVSVKSKLGGHGMEISRRFLLQPTFMCSFYPPPSRCYSQHCYVIVYIYILYRWLSDVWKRDNVGTLELSINTIDNSVTAADWGKNAALRDKLNPGLTF